MNPVRARDRLETFVILAPRNKCGCVTCGDLLTSIYVIFVLFIVRSFLTFNYLLLFPPCHSSEAGHRAKSTPKK